MPSSSPCLTAPGTLSADGTATPLGSVVIYRPPNGWNTDSRARRFTRLPDRHFSREGDMEMLARSVQAVLEQQDERGSFYTDQEYCLGDKVDDQLGAASMLAYYLSQTGCASGVDERLERAVRFHLDHLVQPPTNERKSRYMRYFKDRDTGYDTCNNLWTIWGGSLVLRHGTRYISSGTAAELCDLLAELWSFAFNDPRRDANPCENQMLAYCEVGILYAHTVGRKALVSELLDFYHQHLRRLRIYDRGHWIFPEFNQWDAHYALLSWTMLENLFVTTGDPAFAEDAEEMALYFNERVSAGGYYWGGSRHNECGIDEFIQLPSKWAAELDLNRLLLPSPSELWKQMIMDGHWGRSLVMRLDIPLENRTVKRKVVPTRWHFRQDNASVCLRNDLKLHHLSSAGLEIIPAAGALGSGVTWQAEGGWKTDSVQINTPPDSAGLRFSKSRTIELGNASGLATMQRGYLWEMRQWWIGAGDGLVWIGQLISHAFPQCDRIDFLLGNPVLTILADKAVSVAEVKTAEGVVAETQGEPVRVSSREYLRFGDVFVGATAPMEFVRPARDAFHTFPLPGGRLLRDVPVSNELRLELSETPGKLECCESLFFAIEIGKRSPSIKTRREPNLWRMDCHQGVFEATQVDGRWGYTFDAGAGSQVLPPIGFGYEA